ncbi:MAG: hypothetical protein ACRCS6_10560 [Turicibacter sp.]
MSRKKRKFKLVLALIMMTVALVTGCSKVDKEILVPAYATIDEYIAWGNKHDVTIRLIDSKEEVVELTNYGSMLRITSGSIFPGETLDIVVCPRGSSCKLIMGNDPMKNFTPKLN